MSLESCGAVVESLSETVNIVETRSPPARVPILIGPPIGFCGFLPCGVLPRRSVNDAQPVPQNRHLRPQTPQDSGPTGSRRRSDPPVAGFVASRCGQSDWAMMLGTLQRICEQLQVRCGPVRCMVRAGGPLVGDLQNWSWATRRLSRHHDGGQGNPIQPTVHDTRSTRSAWPRRGSLKHGFWGRRRWGDPFSTFLGVKSTIQRMV